MADSKRVAGVVDRVEGDTAVIVFRDPDSGDHREVYLDKKKLKKVDLKEGDEVAVEMSMLAAGSSKKNMPTKPVKPSKSVSLKKKGKSEYVTIEFAGEKSAEMAKRFFTYLVDGGLEDQLIQNLSGHGVTLEIGNCSKNDLTVLFQCRKDGHIPDTECRSGDG